MLMFKINSKSLRKINEFTFFVSFSILCFLHYDWFFYRSYWVYNHLLYNEILFLNDFIEEEIIQSYLLELNLHEDNMYYSWYNYEAYNNVYEMILQYWRLHKKLVIYAYIYETEPIFSTSIRDFIKVYKYNTKSFYRNKIVTYGSVCLSFTIWTTLLILVKGKRSKIFFLFMNLYTIFFYFNYNLSDFFQNLVIFLAIISGSILYHYYYLFRLLWGSNSVG